MLFALSLIACGDPEPIYVENYGSLADPTQPTHVPLSQDRQLLTAEQEVAQCPSSVVDRALLDRIAEKLEGEPPPGQFLRWEVGPGGGSIVYVSNDVRYTADVLPSVGFHVWERPNGTHDWSHVDAYHDSDFTGCLNFGIGDESRLGPDQKSLRWNESYASDHGLAHHAYWQERYRVAVTALADKLAVE